MDAAHQAIDDLTNAFLADGMNVDDFLAAIETQVDNIEKEAPQQQRGGAHAAEQVVAVAKEGAAVLIQGVTAVAKETAELAETLPSTKVGHHESSVTYGQAMDKVGKGAQGIWKLASALGGFVKDTVEHEVMEAREAAKQAKLMELQLEEEAELENEEEEDMALLEEEEEELRYDLPYDAPTTSTTAFEAKGVDPNLLSSFVLQQRRRTPDEDVLVVSKEELADDECPTPEAGQEPNLLPFFLFQGGGH